MPQTGRILALALLAAAGCGDDGDSTPSSPDASATEPDGAPASGGPYDDVELSRELSFEALTGEVHVVRDRYGIPHIRADSIADLAFAQGYVMAHDRLPQMDLLRRFGSGSLGELYGALEPATIDQDLEMRMHRMRPLAEKALQELRASDDPADADVATTLQSFAAGVNAYASDLQDGDYAVHQDVRDGWNPANFEAWTAVDSLVLGRFQAWALSYQVPIELELDELYRAARTTFDEAADDADPDVVARRGASQDLLRLAPIGRIPTVDGFPGVSAGAPARARTASARRPEVPRSLIQRARDTLAPDLARGAHAFAIPKAGSNSWVSGPSVSGGKAILAGDQHLQLPNPSIFYPNHLVIEGELDVEGISFPGIPGVVLGHNGDVAWSSTVVAHDVADIYRETIVPCDQGGGDCVEFDGGQVAIETWEEEIDIGTYGTIQDTRTVTYERVPHHGPIIPTIENGRIVPRDGDTALSVRYTGYQVTNEIRAFHTINRAESIDDALAAFEHFEYGGQNFVLMDSQGNIGWTIHADIPARDPAVYTWDAETRPDGLAPWFVLPGDGSAEWQGFVDRQHIPEVVNPDKGYLVTANSDPVGVTFDGDPLDGPQVDGERPLFMSAFYVDGLRTARITERLLERIDAAEPITAETMASIQHDSRSNFGATMRPHLSAALDFIDDDTAPADVSAYLDGLPTGRVDAMRDAAQVVAAWTLETPPAVGDGVGQQAITDSTATSLFNAWMHFFIERAFADEFDAMGEDIFASSERMFVRLPVAVFEEPERFATGNAAETDQPLLCDHMATDDVVESCDRIALEAMDAALQWAAGDDGFGTADMTAWRWGKKHTLTFEPLFPNEALDLGPFPREGDTSVVNVADSGFTDLAFTARAHGPAQRFIAVAEPGGRVRARFQLPGGTIFDPSSPHYRDLLDDYYLTEQHFDLPFTTEEVVAAGEERWLLSP